MYTIQLYRAVTDGKQEKEISDSKIVLYPPFLFFFVGQGFYSSSYHYFPLIIVVGLRGELSSQWKR